MSKTTDQEIVEIEQALKDLEDRHPDYIPPELKEIQTRVLVVHAHLENALETRILLQLKKDVPNLDDKSRHAIAWSIRPVLESLSYKSKLEIVKNYKDEVPEKTLSTVNKYRIEFAHPRGMELRNKYNFSTPEGKQNIRNVYRCLLQAYQEMDNYFIKVDGVPKMREKQT